MRLRTRILIDAKELIAVPSLWGQGSMKEIAPRVATDTAGDFPESEHDPPRRCLSGAICAATGIPETQISDDPTTADVIALVRSVIANRYDGYRKLRAFMTIEDIEHCPPSDNDWLVGFNDYSRHDEVIRVLDEAIAQSEPCNECDSPLAVDDVNLVAINNQPEQVMCTHCALLAQYPEG